MSSPSPISRIDHTAGIQELVKVLPNLQANIRRFLAVRKYEVVKVEKEEAEKLKRRAKREKQQSYMQSLSNPRRDGRSPRSPIIDKAKAAVITSPAMARRMKVPKKKINVEEYEQKYLLSPAVEEQAPQSVAPNVLPVQTFDQNITKLMKNINDITLTLNMHDSSLIPHTVSNVRVHGNSYYHEKELGYFDFSIPSASPPKTVTFGDSRNMGNGSIHAGKPVSYDTSNNSNNSNNSNYNTSSMHRSPEGKTAFNDSPDKSVPAHSDQISAVLAGIEAEYANLARTNEQIKAVVSRSAVPSIVGESSVLSDAPSVATHEPHSPHHSSNFNSKHNSPSRNGATSEGLSAYKTISTFNSDDESDHRARESRNSSSRSNLSEAYVPIRRSGDVKLDMMVQETLIRANNSILDRVIQENKVYEGSELDKVMHKVALQINDTYQAIEGAEEERVRKLSTSTTDSVGLDALTRSITAIQQGGTFAAKTSTNTDHELDTPSHSEYPSTNPSNENSANSSMDSQITVDSNTSELSHVSELTLAIQDILANLSGGLFDRARLQLSGPEIPEEDPELLKVIERNESNVAMLNRSRSGLARSLSQQPLEMADYLNSVYGTTNTNVGNDISSDPHPAAASNTDGRNENEAQISPSREPVNNNEQQNQESLDLKVLLEHQERSMQLIRDSIKAIEAQALAQAQVQAQVQAQAQLQAQAQAQEQQHPPNNFSPVKDGGSSQPHPVVHDTTECPDGAEESPREPLNAVRVTPKPKAKKKKVLARRDSHEEQHAPTAAELAMLRNLGSYLQRQKAAQQEESKNLSYAELMHKAQSNLGLMHIKQQNQAALREEHLQRQFRKELLYDQFHYNQQKLEEEERRAVRAAQKEKDSIHARARTQAAMMYPNVYDSDQEGTVQSSSDVAMIEEHHHLFHQPYHQDNRDYRKSKVRYEEDEHEHRKPHPHSSYTYGEEQKLSYASHLGHSSLSSLQSDIKGYSGAHMDAPPRPYNDYETDNDPYPAQHSNGDVYPHKPTFSSPRIQAHPHNTFHSPNNKLHKSSPPKEPFNMSDALLHAPVMTFSGSSAIDNLFSFSYLTFSIVFLFARQWALRWGQIQFHKPAEETH